MVDFHVRQALQKLHRQNFNQPKVDVSQSALNNQGQMSAKSLINQMQANIINNLQQQVINPETFKMNHLASVDRSIYIKNLLKLPNNITDLLILFSENKLSPKDLNNMLVQQQANNSQTQLQNQQQQNLQNLIQQQVQGNQPQQQNQPQVQPQVQPPVVAPNEQANQGPQKPQQNQQHNNNPNQGQNQSNEPSQKPQLTNNPSPVFQQSLQAQLKHQLNLQALINKGIPTGGAAPNGTEEALLPQQNQNPSSIQQRLNQQLLNHARFEPLANLQESVRRQIRQPIDFVPKQSVEKLQQEVTQELSQLENKVLEEVFTQNNKVKPLPDKVNLSVINTLLQKHSKIALNNLIVEMSNAAKQGIMDTKPIQETIGLINSSIVATAQNDTALAIKNLMLLYLPWLPLEEGVGFKLDVETKNSQSADDDTSISIMITTKNYGNISATINLITTNSVDIFITCSKEFPKSELLKRLNKDSSEHSMSTSIGIEEISQPSQIPTDVQKAKVNLSNVTTINPYLLLISHSFIRHAVEIDINTTMFGQAHQ